MLNINVTSDIDAAMASVGDFFRSQIPFATSVALNNGAFDIRNEIVTVTWSKAFRVRNRALPGRMFQVVKKARKTDLAAVVAQTLDRDWTARQAAGGVKTGRAGGRVAIPTTPDKMRTATGRIRAPLKPARLAGTKGVFAVQSGGRTLIVKRVRKKTTLLYAIVPSARIPKRFRFYEDATLTAIRVFPGYWNIAMNAAIHQSRFNAK